MPAAKSRKDANGGGVEIERTGTSLVVSAGGQRITLHAGDPQDETPGPPDGQSRPLVGAVDLASRIGDAMTFCAPAEYRDVAKGPYVYLRDAPDGTLVVPVIVATDGHRLYVDGDARDCADGDTVLRIPGDNWPSAARALDAAFERVRLVRTVIPEPACDGDGSEKPADRRLDHLVFESPDREVRVLLEEPQTTLPHWASFVPRETGDCRFDVTCDKTDLARAAKAASPASRLSSKTCMLKQVRDRGMLGIRSDDLDGGTVVQEIDAGIQGASDLHVHLNPKYVLDALGAIGTQKVRIRQALPPLDPVRFLEVDEQGTEPRPRAIVVMPVRGHDPTEEAGNEAARESGDPQPQDSAAAPRAAAGA
jgi:hypothetical protein